MLDTTILFYNYLGYKVIVISRKIVTLQFSWDLVEVREKLQMSFLPYTHILILLTSRVQFMPDSMVILSFLQF